MICLLAALVGPACLSCGCLGALAVACGLKSLGAVLSGRAVSLGWKSPLTRARLTGRSPWVAGSGLLDTRRVRGPSSVRFTSVPLLSGALGTFAGTTSPLRRAVAFVCQFWAAFLAVRRLFHEPPLMLGLVRMPLSGMEKLRRMPSSAMAAAAVAVGVAVAVPVTRLAWWWSLRWWYLWWWRASTAAAAAAARRPWGPVRRMHARELFWWVGPR